MGDSQSQPNQISGSLFAPNAKTTYASNIASVPQSSKAFKIVNRYTQRCLEIDDGRSGTGELVQQWESNNNAWTYWKLVEGKYLQNVHTGKHMMPCPFSIKNGTKVMQTTDRSPYAEWKIESPYIIHVKTGMCLEIDDGNKSNGMKAQLWDKNSNQWAHWNLYYVM